MGCSPYCRIPEKKLTMTMKATFCAARTITPTTIVLGLANYIPDSKGFALTR
jgi:hypothetical protein